MKTKDLAKPHSEKIPQLAEKSPFDHVEVEVIDVKPESPAQQVDSEIESFLKLVGRQEILDAYGCITTALWAENIHNIKASKGYKKQGLTWSQACAKYFPHLSVDTCDRWASAFGQFGAQFFHVRDVVQISAQAYRQLNPEFTEDGKICIAGQEFVLSKSNAGAIQSAIEAYRQQLADKAEEASRAKATASKAKEQAENARKAAEAAQKKLTDRDNPSLRWKNADLDHAFLLDLQAKFDLMAEQIRSYTQRGLTPENQDRFVAFCEYTFSIMHQVTERAKAEYGEGFCSAAPPSVFAEVDALTPDKRNLVGEYNQAHLKE